ncbi:MAG: SH3 domain-containing protein [Eubacteriales bacterium]|nr:SH3 domain-containing protein [Eubacteriales bacterium]
MKKRFVCALLALVLLVGLVPVTASAADQKISEAAITVLKQLATFRNTCYYVSGSEYRTGYGTVCSEKHHFDTTGKPKSTDENEHTISQAQADTALRTYLTELDKQVNSFASKNGLTLSQSQHDALVVYSHLSGTAWLSGTGTLKSAVVSKVSATELMSVLDNLSSNTEQNQVIANMYVNGVYSNTVPAQYKTVTYDVNSPSGAAAKLSVSDDETYTMYFDTTKMVSHITASCPGYIFLGWYTEPVNGRWMPKLNAACVDTGVNSDGTLYAYWQVEDDYYGSEVSGTTVDYPMMAGDLVSTTVYVRPEDGAEAAKNSSGKTATVSGSIVILQDYLDANGNRWGYVVYEEGESGEEDQYGWVKIGKTVEDVLAKDVIATATVTYNGYLNVRKGAGTDYQIVGALAKGDTVKLYEIKTVNGHRWGRCDAGWICLTYTSVIMVDGSSTNDDGAAAYAFTGTVTMDAEPYVAAGDSSAQIHLVDAYGEEYFDIPSGTSIKISNLTIAPYDGDSVTWAKVYWSNKELDKNGKEIYVNRTAWLPIAGAGVVIGSEPEFDVELDPVKYTVVADTTSVRENAGDASQLAFTLNKGVEVEVYEVRLVGENIWGSIVVTKAEDSVLSETGWINLASKYVKRSSEVTLDEEDTKKDDNDTGLIATVIDTDSVRVRKTGALYGAVMGSLSRGTTVRVWESKKDEWYKLDTNQNGVYDYDGDGWVSARYLNVREGTLDDPNQVTDSSGNTISTDGTGTGIVANTYAGVNVRQGAGTNYAAVGKLLPGTQVEILEVKTVGAAKWGRTDKGWVCMDYISMVKYNPVTPTVEEDPTKGTLVDSLDNLEKTTTTAIYTGEAVASCDILREPIDFSNQDLSDPEVAAKYEANRVRTLDAGSNVTIHELATVTQKVKSDKEDLGDGNKTVTTVTTTTYWARVNDGWIQDPEDNLELDALDEKVHTLTGSDTLKVREGASQDTAKIDVLEKGDQVKVTALEIEEDKVWGRIETEEGSGWIRMDYMTEGAYYVNVTTATEPTTAASEPVYGSTGNTSSGGFVTNSGGYRYTGKVIRTNELNVRATASTTAKKTTTLRNGDSLVIYETTIAENMAWGRCDAGWVYLYYVDLTPCVGGAVDARVVYNDNTVAYSDVNCTTATGTYARMSVVDIYEIVGKMARTDLGWINTDNLL